jgi:glyoxylase-like metal-dependent hydrolase (beta-lactamase superfamily II)
VASHDRREEFSMSTQIVSRHVHQLRTAISNVFLIEADGGGWVLVDAGMRGYASSIARAAGHLFGGRPPHAIVLTHGHFDHVGSLGALLARWDVPVYAHPLELPHLTGRLPYPRPDPLVGGGMMAWSSRLLPSAPIDVGPRLLALPPTDDVPFLPGWRVVHTPGHTEGHVSLFRDADRTLVAGDAVITVAQESLLAVASQAPTMHGPPAYFTTDWDAARESARTLAALAPETLAAGHGRPLHGAPMRHALQELASRFDERARPPRGRYVRQPARLIDGRYDLPPDPWPAVAATAAAGVGLVLACWPIVRRLTRPSASATAAGRRRQGGVVGADPSRDQVRVRRAGPSGGSSLPTNSSVIRA